MRLALCAIVAGEVERRGEGLRRLGFLAALLPLDDAGRLAPASAQIIKLGASHLAAAHDLEPRRDVDAVVLGVVAGNALAELGCPRRKSVAQCFGLERPRRGRGCKPSASRASRNALCTMWVAVCAREMARRRWTSTRLTADWPTSTLPSTTRHARRFVVSRYSLMK